MLLRSLRLPSPPLPWIPSSRPSLPSSHLSLPSSSTLPAAVRAALDGAAARPPLERDREVEDGGPTSVPLEVIDGELGFDRVVAEQEEGRTVVVLWMANWCRKCIYLKPKLEKLAATYYPGVRFYCVDVNSVPQKLVSRAGVTLWRDGKKQGEVIGGHKAWVVVNEVQQMLDNED